MSHKNICIKEAYDWIYISDKDNKNSITQNQYNQLMDYLEREYNNTIVEIKNGKFRFINYVGFIQLNNLSIEILPKLSLSRDEDSDEKDRYILLKMLTRCGYFPLQWGKEALLDISNSNLLEIIGILYVKQLIKELNKGLYTDYICEEDNLYKIKGRIVLKNHINKNIFNKSKVYCRYDEFSENNSLNQLFKFTLNLLVRYIADTKIQSYIKRGLHQLAKVDDIIIEPMLIEKIIINRQNKRFNNAFILAKMIIKKLSFTNNLGMIDGFSFLFEMNILYEKYIGTIVTDIWNDYTYNYTLLQHNEKRLLKNVRSNRGNILLKPDIILRKKDGAEINDFIIIDTKWKNISMNGRVNYNQSDIYQMYAYITSYENSKRCILLYPRSDEELKNYPIWELNDPFMDKFIEIHTVSLDKEENTIKDLKQILNIH